MFHMNDLTMDVLNDFANRFGINPADLLDSTPTSLWDDPDELRTFWEYNEQHGITPKSLDPIVHDDPCDFGLGVIALGLLF